MIHVYGSDIILRDWFISNYIALNYKLQWICFV